MTKFLHKINKHENYIKNINEDHQFNITLCEDEYHLHYDKYVPETKLVVYYDIQDISNPTTIFTNYDGSFKSMEIDGDVSIDITTQGDITYQFNRTGEHIIKYELNGLCVGNNVPLFFNVSTIKIIIIPNIFTSISQYAFNNCSGLTSVTIGSGVTSIDKSAFRGCGALTSVTIPDSVTSIGDSAFNGCTSLTSVTIPDSVTNIGSWVFQNCSALTSVILGSGLTTIEYSAFSYCTALTSITIPDNVTSIGNQAFENCTSLTSIICNAAVAPTIHNNTFKAVHTDGTLTVLSGSTGYDVWMGTDDYYLGSYNWTKVEQ